MCIELMSEGLVRSITYVLCRYVHVCVLKTPNF